MNALISFCHFCELHGPRILLCTQTLPKDADQSLTADFLAFESPALKSTIAASSTRHADECPACCWGRLDKGLLTHSSSHLYISSYRPLNQDLYAVVRQACVRSLSCEAAPGRDGPVIFGDGQKGHVYSYAFHLPDPHARGGQRWYSVAMVSADQHQLIGGWHFLTTHFRDLIARLLRKVEAATSNGEDSARVSMSRSMNFSSRAEMLRQRGSKPLSSLEHLTKDNNVMVFVHAFFAWILKNYAERIIEKIVDGSVRLAPAIDESSEYERADSPISLAFYTEGRASVAVSECVSLRSQQLASLKEVYGSMETEHFLLVVHHLLVGNQVVVRSAESSLSTSMLTALATFLPAGCCAILLDQAEYRESYICNMLGLRNFAEIPPIAAPCVVMDLKRFREVKNDPNTQSLLGPDENNEEDDVIFLLRTRNAPSTLTSTTTLLRAIWALLEQDLSEAAMQLRIAALREQWCQYAKVYYKLARRVDATPERIAAFLQAFGLQEEDLDVLRFWTQALSRAHRVALVLVDRAEE